MIVFRVIVLVIVVLVDGGSVVVGFVDVGVVVDYLRFLRHVWQSLQKSLLFTLGGSNLFLGGGGC